MFSFEETAVFFTLQVCAQLVLVLSKNCDMNLYGESGTFSSQHSNELYENNMVCWFTIQVEKGFGVKLMWETFDLAGEMPLCSSGDYVEVYVGCNKNTIGRFCSSNTKTIHDIYSPDNCLAIMFKSDEVDVEKGFKVKYESINLNQAIGSSSGCGRTDLTSSAEVINSPGWPVNYPPTKECIWEINVEKDNHIKISFMEFNLQGSTYCGSHDDHVEIRGGDKNSYFLSASKVQDRLCGKRMPFYLTSSHEKIFVRFKSDSFTESRGFIAGYVIYTPEKSSGIFMISVVIGVLVFLAVLACCIGVCCFYRHQSRKRKRRTARRARAQATNQEQQSGDQSEPLQQRTPAPVTGPPPPYSLTPEYPTPRPAQPTGYSLPYPTQPNQPPFNPDYPARLEFSAGQMDSSPPYPNGNDLPVDPPPYSTLPRPL